MPTDKRKRGQPSKKRKQPKKAGRKPQRRDAPTEPSPSVQPGQPGQPGTRRRPGEGLDKSDEGVIAGGRLAGQRFTG
jgi:hypothetical protein